MEGEIFMRNIYRVGQEELKEKLDLYISRKKKAEEKGYIDNPKYKSVILELDFRINELKNILLYINVLPNHLSDIDELFKCTASTINNLFNVKAGHDKEDNKMLKAAFEKAVKEKCDIWDDMYAALDLFDKGYDYNNKIQLHVDMINYIVRSTFYFIAFREIICKID